MPKKQLTCPVETTLNVIDGRWKVLIIQQLLEGAKRFNQLQRELPSITHRMLSKQLREMEEHGLVIRTDYQEIPPKVEYRLSELGKSLEAILIAMHQWAEQYGSHISVQTENTAN